jgi:hypothetical protein
MGAHHPTDVPSLEEVRNVDRWAREYADGIVRGVKLGVP